MNVWERVCVRVDRTRFRVSPTQTAMADMELEFEHIDWNDIVDAELSGDQSMLDQLR